MTKQKTSSILVITACVLLLLFCSACGSAPKESAVPDTSPAVSSSATEESRGAYDLDLTVLDSNMIYANIYSMMEHPDKYVGKHIRIRGNFATATVWSTVYFACVIPDATACCSQGLEFILAKERAYPAEYPKEGTEITVSGIFETYWEGEQLYCRLKEAEMQE